jgi:hypothetical protein
MAHGGAHCDDRGLTFMKQGGLADWLAFDIVDSRWTELAPPLASASPLPVLVGHGAAFDARSGRVILLRAAPVEHDATSTTLTGIVFETSGEPSRWTHRRLASRGVGPSVRSGYGLAIAGRRLVVFGGKEQRFHATGPRTSWPDDVVVLDLETFAWMTLPIAGATPDGRDHHGLVALDDDHVLIACGGRNVDDRRSAFTDLHVLDLASRRVRRVAEELRVAPGATWVAFGEGRARRVLVVGGDAEGAPVIEVDWRAL